MHLRHPPEEDIVMPTLHALFLRRTTWIIVTTALLAGCVRGEANEPADAAAVQALFQEGEALVTAGGAANLTQAMEKFRQVVAMDSTHAGAWLALARADNQRGPNSSSLSPVQTLPELRRAAEAAVRYAPEDASAHVALAGAKVADWDWPTAEAEFRRALELDAVNGPAVRGLASLLFVLGRV